MMKIYLLTIFVLSILLLVERIHAIKSSSYCWIASPLSSISTIITQDALRSKRKRGGMMLLSRRNRRGRPGGGPLFVLPPPSPEMIDSLSQSSYTVPEVTTEQLWVGFIAGVFPFIFAAYEFWKRIDTQQRCAVCQGTGLVSISKTGKALKVPRKCFNCGGLVPWAGWKAFWTGTFDIGNGGVLQRPAADYDRVSEEEAAQMTTTTACQSDEKPISGGKCCAYVKCGAQMDKPLRCSRCLGVAYCSKACQTADWTGDHKTACQHLAMTSLQSLLNSHWQGKLTKMKSWLDSIINALISNKPLPKLLPPKEVMTTLAGLMKHLKTFTSDLRLTALIVHALLGLQPDCTMSNMAREVVLKDVQTALAEMKAQLPGKEGLILSAHITCGKLYNAMKRHTEAMEHAHRVRGEVDAIAEMGKISFNTAFSSSAIVLCALFFYTAVDWFRDGESDDIFRTGACAAQAVEMAQRGLVIIQWRKENDSQPHKQKLLETLALRRAHKQCLEMAKQLIHEADPEDAAYILLLMARSHINLYQYEDAEVAAKRSIALVEKLPSTIKAYLWRLYLILAESYASRAMYHEAEATFYIALNCIVGVQFGNPQFLNEAVNFATKLARKVFEDAGKFEDALQVDDMVVALRGGPILNNPPDILRRSAIRALRKGEIEDAGRVLKSLIFRYRAYYDKRVAQQLPDSELVSLTLPLEVAAEALERYGSRMADVLGESDGAAFAKCLREEINENRAIEDALRKAMLLETREEARAAILGRGRHGGDDEWVVEGGGGKSKGGRKKKQKGRGKSKRKEGGGEEEARKGRRRGGSKKGEEGGGSGGGSVEGGAVSVEASVQHGGSPKVKEEVEVEQEGGGKNEEGEEEECCICFFDLQKDIIDTARLACSHVYHRECLDLWVNKCQIKECPPTCPMCRAPICRVVTAQIGV